MGFIGLHSRSSRCRLQFVHNNWASIACMQPGLCQSTFTFKFSFRVSAAKNSQRRAHYLDDNDIVMNLFCCDTRYKGTGSDLDNN